jgi:hypothetical protein
MPIPEDAVLGGAFVYANHYTDYPREGGTPYYLERNNTFSIIGYGGGGETAQNLSTTLSTDETANYETTFILPEDSTNGTYRVYATSSYNEASVSNSTTFQIGEIQHIKIGDLGGGMPPVFAQFDGVIDGVDLALFIQCYKQLAPLEYMYLADLGGPVDYIPTFFAFDGKVDAFDLALFIQCYKGLGPPL